ncbi:helix-turn-helix transcriptional regulator, partial [Parapedobacter tibetensis]|uniref:helix-turn-helix transcriptional regulator n=1 Tax=Parapedobacter tibetensis TaxID=2972951 RepID=UPI00214DEE36
ELLERLRTKNHRCRTSKAHRMDDQMRITVVGLLNLPFMEGMKLDHAIDGYVVQLHELHRLRYALPTATHERRNAPEQHPNTLIEAIEQGVRQQLKAQRYPSVDKLATDLGKSRQLLHRRFHKSKGQSIKAYITDAVMEAALRLLRDERLPPAAVAYRLGYTEQTSFNHQFKGYYGMSPSEARETKEAPTIQGTK